MKKTPNKVTTEDLLKALESTPEESKEVLEVFDYRNDVPLFLSHYCIEAGEHKVPKLNLYRLYIQYSKESIDFTRFKLSMNNFVNNETVSLYGINKTKFEIMTLLHKKKKKQPRYNPSNLATRKHFEQFLEENSIRRGNKWIEAYIVFGIYKKWCQAKGTILRFKLKPFTSICKLFFESKRTAQYDAWLKVDEAMLELLTDEDKRKIQIDRRTEYEQARRKKEANKKR